MLFSIITFVFLAVGGLCSLAGFWPGLILFHPPHAGALGGVFLLAGSASALGWVVQVRRLSRPLGRQIGAMSQQGRLQPIESGHQILSPLVRAVNEVTELAEHTISDAARRVKEMEIQLKVVTT